MMWIYAFNDAVVSPPDIDTAWPKIQPLPDDFPNENVLSILEKTFPEKNGDELIRLEDHIRHNASTLLCQCAETESSEILRKLQPSPANLRFEIGEPCENPNPDFLPPLSEGQWKICVGCQKFTLKDHIGRCDKRWCCKWGASEPKEWNIDQKHVPYHPQCLRIVRHFRFEAALLCYAERYREEILQKAESKQLLAERERLIRRDVGAAAEAGDFIRLRKRCAELGESFADFAAEYDVFSRMLNFWEVNQHLIDNVRLLHAEGITIPEEWCKVLLGLPGENDNFCAELKQLLGKMPLEKNGENKCLHEK